MTQRWWRRARPAAHRPSSRRDAGPDRRAASPRVLRSTGPRGRAASRFRRLWALERQRLEAVDNLMPGAFPRRQARLLASEIFPSPATAAFHACLPTPVVVRRAANRIRQSGIKARLAFAVAEFIHHPDHYITGADLKHADTPPKPPAEGFADKDCPARSSD